MEDFGLKLIIVYIKNMKPKKDIEAIHKHDLRAMLQNLGLLGDFDAQKIKCQFCKEIMQESNFGAIYTQDKKIMFSCSKLECFNKLPKK